MAYEEEPFPKGPEPIDYEDYDEYEEPEWIDDVLDREDEAEYRLLGTSPDTGSGDESPTEKSERRGLGQRLSEARESHEERAILRRKMKELETERKLSLQISKTRLAELKKKERMSRPSYGSRLQKIGTLGGPIKRQNLQLYSGGKSKGFYIPRPMPVSGRSFGDTGLASMPRRIPVSGKPTLGLGEMRRLNAPGGVGGMRSVVAPGKPSRGSLEGMRSLTNPSLGGLRRVGSAGYSSSPLSNTRLVMPSTRLATKRLVPRRSNLPYRRKLRRMKKEV